MFFFYTKVNFLLLPLKTLVLLWSIGTQKGGTVDTQRVKSKVWIRGNGGPPGRSLSWFLSSNPGRTNITEEKVLSL